MALSLPVLALAVIAQSYLRHDDPHSLAVIRSYAWTVFTCHTAGAALVCGLAPVARKVFHAK